MSQPTALILIADGTEEIEFVTPYDVLTRAGFKVESVGIDLKEYYATCSRNVRIVPDKRTIEISHSAVPSIVIVPGGGPGAKTLTASRDVKQLLDFVKMMGGWTASICAGTTAVVAAGTSGDLGGWKARVTSHPSVKDEIVAKGWEYAGDGERVVVDEKEKVITSRGPGTAMLFSLTIVEVIMGKEKRDEISGPMILADTL
ncbi:MAG: hypothetical protein M1824_005743 [Vezdaea acicularis]|nr:MAG: hypothetical protein M1824_005743 [Vezdaea acicularis]